MKRVDSFWYVFVALASLLVGFVLGGQARPEHPAEVPQADGDQSQYKEIRSVAEFISRTINDPNAGWTAIGVVVSCLLFGLAIWQMQLIRKANKAAGASADAAKAAAEVGAGTLRAFMRSERAKLQLMEGHIEPDPNTRPPEPLLHFGFLNIGKTETTIHWLQMGFFVTINVAPDLPALTRGRSGPQASMVPSNSRFGTRAWHPFVVPPCLVNAPIDSATWDEIFAERSHLIFQGFFSLEDTFGDFTRQRFCARWNPDRNTLQTVTIVGANEEIPEPNWPRGNP